MPETETRRSPRFERYLARLRKKALVRHAYARTKLPEDVRAVCLWDGTRSWYVITPGFPYDPGAWRVSIWDKAGPVGHYGDDVFGRPLMDVWHALHHVMMEHPEVRITEYVDDSGRHVRLAGGPGCPG